MAPKTVKSRLDELKKLKEYQVLATNPRVSLIIFIEYGTKFIYMIVYYIIIHKYNN